MSQSKMRSEYPYMTVEDDGKMNQSSVHKVKKEPIKTEYPHMTVEDGMPNLKLSHHMDQ